jgi:hypothetical protein
MDDIHCMAWIQSLSFMMFMLGFYDVSKRRKAQVQKQQPYQCEQPRQTIVNCHSQQEERYSLHLGLMARLVTATQTDIDFYNTRRVNSTGAQKCRNGFDSLKLDFPATI